MGTIFLFCAAVGGTVLVLQFLLTLIGLGGDALDADVSGDMGDVGDLDFDGDFDADHADSTTAFKVISFRTVIAGLTFFGLGGLGAQSAEASPSMVIGVAVGAGVVAMYGVFWLFRSLHMLKSEGTVHIKNAIGTHGTVYLKIPANDSGAGKVQVNVQSRTAEYLAMTAGEELTTGTKIVVVDVVTPTTVQVEPVLEPERNNHV